MSRCFDLSISRYLNVSMSLSMFRCLDVYLDVSLDLSLDVYLDVSLDLSMLSLYLSLSPQATRRNTLVGVHGSGVSTSVGGSVSSKKKWGGRHTRELSPERTRRSR